MYCLARVSRSLQHTRPIAPVLKRSIISPFHARFNTAAAAAAAAAPARVQESVQESPKNDLDSLISSLPLVQSLRHEHASSYKESRPHLTIPPSLRQTHFVAGTLSGPRKVTIAPYVWTSKPSSSSSRENEKKSRVISIFHIGSHLCGHPGYVHGGLLSVMFDEAFARCISTAFPSGLGMTANLNVDFRKPGAPDRLYVLTAETVRVEGRKAWVEGKMTLLPETGTEGESVTVAEARALFVEPKFVESIIPVYKN